MRIFFSDACPIFVGFFDAPTTAMLFGLKNVSSDCFISVSSLVFFDILFDYLNILKCSIYFSRYVIIYIVA